VPVSLLALGVVLFQAAAATPTPVPAATRTPTPRPVSAGPRTLQDVARERRLSGAKGKGSLGTISAGPSTSSPAPKVSPEVGAAAASTPAPEPASAAYVRVASASNDGIVDSTGGVRVLGTVRNAGSGAVCNVVIAVKIFDSRGNYLASGQTAPDVAVIPPGEIVSFHTTVQAPPGVRGALRNPDRKDLTEGSTTMGGEWKLLGGTEASVASATEDCAR
jgi:hypothetical protein